MVETQGRGTLHIHFLIWLIGAPVNSQAFEDTVAKHGGAFTEGLEAYADSVVTNELPLPVGEAQCRQCGGRGDFVPLHIPPRARRNGSKRDSNKQMEPLLVQCRHCGHESSAQHLIRQVLLQHRPPHWPPPLAQLDATDISTNAAREVRARSSYAEALNAVERREMFHAAVVRDHSDEIAEWMQRISDSPQLGNVHADNDPMKIDPMHRLIEMMPPTLDRSRMSLQHYAYMLACLVVNLNMHAWTHTGSCFKTSRATSSACVCRYGFPRERAGKSSLFGPNVVMKRTLGHEYINGYNSTIMAMFKCNHDVQILFGGKDAINRIYYCCKYVTKPQRQIDSTTAVALASFQRRRSKEVTDLASDAPPALNDIRRRRVTGMVHTFTNKQEIAGPLAALYLLRGSCCYPSANCVKLPLADIIKQLENSGDYVCTLVQSRATQNAMFRSTSALGDYIYRPQSTSNASLYEFTMRCYRRQMTSSVAESHQFSYLHPLSASHCVAFRRIDAVPVIKGPRLARQKEKMTRDELEGFAKIALVLFKPFRNMSDLLDGTENEVQPWHSAYSKWQASRSEFTKTIMNNMNDYYVGRDAESEAIVQAGEARDEEDPQLSSSDDDASDDGYMSDDFVETADDEDTADVFPLLDDSNGTDNDDQLLQTFPSPSTYSDRIQGVLKGFERHQLVENIALGVASVYTSSLSGLSVVDQTPEELRKWVGNAASDSFEGERRESTQGEAAEKPTTVTEIIDGALLPEHIRWNPASPVPTEAPMYSGIATLSRLFTLNELQHGAFAVIATSLLHRWKPSSDDENTTASDEQLHQPQLRMFLGGEGGTGKSRVIQAVQELCRSWNRPGAVIVSAMTGKAASLISGRTLASFEVSLRSPSSHVAQQDVDCLIVDEVSMMSKDQLLRLDRLLRRAKRVNGVSFGGIHVVLVGDFLQLPPVGAAPLFVDPATKRKVTLQDFEGFHLWRKFDTVVVLRESVRFRDDPSWGEGCSKARVGEWTSEFVEMINARVVPQDGGSEGSAFVLPPRGTIFVTPDNDTRAAINNHFVACTARQLPHGRIPIRVVANFKGALRKLSPSDVSHIMGLPDTKFGRMAPYLDLIVGMPIQVTQNIRTKKGVANGTMGTLHHIEFPQHTTFRRVLDKRTGAVVLLPDTRPLLAILRLDRGKDVAPLAEGADPRLFPVFPDAEAFSKTVIQLASSSAGEPRSLSIKIQQFPFVCAVGATVYKVQGESLKSMVVIDWKVDARGANKPQQTYLMVSRVVKRESLVCMTPLTSQITNWAKPPDSAVREDRRLASESKLTLTKFYEDHMCK